MEDLGLINPSIDSGENVKHGEDHGGDFLVKTQREILNKGAIFLDPGFEWKVLEISDILLESIVDVSILSLKKISAWV